MEDAMQHISRRPDGRSPNFIVRLTAPTAIQHLIPKSDRQFRKSTGTADRAKAKAIGSKMIADKRLEWLALLNAEPAANSSVPTVLTSSLIQQIAGARLNSWLETDRLERYGDEGLDEDDLAAMETFCRYTDAAMRSVLAQAKGSGKWHDVVADVLDWCLQLGHKIEPSDPEFPTLVRAFAKSEKTAQEFIAARNRGDEPEEPQSLAPVGTRLSEMNAHFIEYKSASVGPKSVSTSLDIWDKFVLFKGDVLLNDVVSNDVYEFFEARLFAAVKPWSQNYLNNHVRRKLNDIFALARTKSLMTAANPIATLELMPKLSPAERKSREKPRRSLVSDKVNELFSSEWYKPTSTFFIGKLRDDLAVRYFGPLIGELHGSRIREILQLMTGDILEVDGILCFKFQTELMDEPKETEPSDEVALPTRHLKNSSVHRTIPVHPKLVELGFAKFVAEHRKAAGRSVPLFSSAVPEPGGKSPTWGRAFEQAFLRYVRDTLNFGSGYGFHGFRHQFEDRIRKSQAKAVWPAGLGQFLSGRKLPRDADKNVFRDVGSEADYGDGYDPSSLLPYLARLDFDDIKFPVPFHEWLKT
jgi:integrase